jgi:hypothetical protein
MFISFVPRKQNRISHPFFCVDNHYFISTTRLKSKALIPMQGHEGDREMPERSADPNSPPTIVTATKKSVAQSQLETAIVCGFNMAIQFRSSRWRAQRMIAITIWVVT